MLTIIRVILNKLFLKYHFFRGGGIIIGKMVNFNPRFLQYSVQ